MKVSVPHDPLLDLILWNLLFSCFVMLFALQLCGVKHSTCWYWKCGSDAGGRNTADQAESSWICVVLLQQTGPALLDKPQGLSV